MTIVILMYMCRTQLIMTMTVMLTHMMKTTNMSRYGCSRITRTCLLSITITTTTVIMTMLIRYRLAQTFLTSARNSFSLTNGSIPKPLRKPFTLLCPQKAHPRRPESQQGLEASEGKTKLCLLIHLYLTTTIIAIIPDTITTILIKLREKPPVGFPPTLCQFPASLDIQVAGHTSMRRYDEFILMPSFRKIGILAACF